MMDGRTKTWSTCFIPDDQSLIGVCLSYRRGATVILRGDELRDECPLPEVTYRSTEKYRLFVTVPGRGDPGDQRIAQRLYDLCCAGQMQQARELAASIRWSVAIMGVPGRAVAVTDYEHNTLYHTENFPSWAGSILIGAAITGTSPYPLIPGLA